MRKYRIPVALYLLILICFFLPFVTVSCADTNIATLTGIDLVKGSTVEGNDIEPYPIAVAMLIITVVGIIFGLGLWKNKKSDILATLLAVGGFITTLIARIVIDSEVAKEGQGSLQTSYQSGFYLMLFLYFATAVYNLVLYKKESIEKDPIEKSSKLNITAMPTEITCHRCGGKNKATDSYCGHCGTGIIQQSLSKVCPSCGMIDKLNGCFSVHCGASLTEQSRTNTSITPVNDKPDISVTTELVYTEPLTPVEIAVIKVNKGSKEDVIAITKPEFVIGRNPEEVDYVISNSTHVGRRHAKLMQMNEAYHLVDLNSKNGTFLNGERIESKKPYPLNYGDKITLANTEIIFEKIQ